MRICHLNFFKIINVFLIDKKKDKASKYEKRKDKIIKCYKK